MIFASRLGRELTEGLISHTMRRISSVKIPCRLLSTSSIWAIHKVPVMLSISNEVKFSWKAKEYVS